jgi:hypothetical protein
VIIVIAAFGSDLHPLGARVPPGNIEATGD